MTDDRHVVDDMYNMRVVDDMFDMHVGHDGYTVHMADDVYNMHVVYEVYNIIPFLCCPSRGPSGQQKCPLTIMLAGFGGNTNNKKQTEANMKQQVTCML